MLSSLCTRVPVPARLTFLSLLVASLFFVGADAGRAPSWGDPTAAQINAYIPAGADLEGMGSTIVAAARRFCLPTTAMLIIMKQEINFGKGYDGLKRYNNFGGLTVGAHPWPGQIGVATLKRRFAIFASKAAGINAIAQNLATKRYVGHSVREVFGMWLTGSYTRASDGDGYYASSYMHTARVVINGLGGSFSPRLRLTRACGTPGGPKGDPAPVPAPVPGVSPQVERFLELTNAARAASGVGPLIVHPAPQTSAQRYAERLAAANFHAPDNTRAWHTFGGDTKDQRLRAAGCVNPAHVAENVGVNATADQVFTMFMNEAPTPDGHRWHREQLLDARNRLIGIGRAGAASGRVFWVNDFSSNC